MRIHSIISVAQLEPSTATTRDSNPYERIFNQESLSIEDTHDKSKLKRIINKRITKSETKYLVK